MRSLLEVSPLRLLPFRKPSPFPGVVAKVVFDCSAAAPLENPMRGAGRRPTPATPNPATPKLSQPHSTFRGPRADKIWSTGPFSPGNLRTGETVTNERRKTIWVNKPAQKKLILAVSLMPTLGLTIATVMVGFLCRRVLEEAIVAEVELPTLLPLFGAVLFFIVTAGAVVLIQALNLSHRVAGPMYRIIESMKRMRSGDIGFRVTLRKGDHLNEIADELNNVIDWLNVNPPPGVSRGADLVNIEPKLIDIVGLNDVQGPPVGAQPSKVEAPSES